MDLNNGKVLKIDHSYINKKYIDPLGLNKPIRTNHNCGSNYNLLMD